MENNSNSIYGALNALYNNIDSSVLNDSEKNAMKLLVDKLKTYFIREYEEIVNSLNRRKNNRLFVLLTRMADYIQDIHDTLNGKYMPYEVINKIYRDISYDPKKGRFKIKRLNKQ